MPFTTCHPSSCHSERREDLRIPLERRPLSREIPRCAARDDTYELSAIGYQLSASGLLELAVWPSLLLDFSTARLLDSPFQARRRDAADEVALGKKKTITIGNVVSTAPAMISGHSRVRCAWKAKRPRRGGKEAIHSNGTGRVLRTSPRGGLPPTPCSWSDHRPRGRRRAAEAQ